MNDAFDKSDAGPAVLEVDRLLHEFYEAELPRPWPRLRLPQARQTRRQQVRCIRPLFRFALAASLLLALFGYWMLAGQFSDRQSGGALLDGPEIGDNPFKHRPPVKRLVPIERQRTPGGNDAQVFEEGTPGGNVIIIIGPTNTKGMR